MNVKRRNQYGHTKISFYLGIFAAFVLFILGVKNIRESFGTLCVMESIMALFGICYITIIETREFRLKPKIFKRIESKTFLRGIVIFAISVFIQAILQQVPFTIRDSEMAFAIILAAPAEELFFRAFLLGIFMKAGEKSTKKIKIYRKQEISFLEIIGIIISGTLFAFMHTNYYDNPSILISILVTGLVIGLLYVLWKDLTACILGHLILNIVAVGQLFFMFNV